jgi:hypothetical protein
MKENRFLYTFAYYGCLAILCLALIVAPFGCKKESEELVFELDEVSAFEVPEELHWYFVSGQPADCNELPDPNVRKYPAFKSDKPLYGSVQLPSEFHQKPYGLSYNFAIDESAGTGQGYDRLYFDLNRDLDMTNEAFLSSMDNPPKGAILNNSWIKKQIYFHCMDVPFDFGSEGHHLLEILPRLIMREGESPLLTFVTTKARKGKIQIAGHKYDVWLGHNRRFTGSFNNPSTALHLIPDGDMSRHTNRDPVWLMFIRKIGRIHYCFSAAPSGGKLIVKSYKGKYGTLKIGTGGRDIRKTKISGHVGSGSDEWSIDTIIPIGGKPNRWGERKAVHSDRVPVGDYIPWLEIYLDRLHLTISQNIHSDGNRMAKLDGPHTFPVKIREDKPFVLDFSDKPEIIFVAPARNHKLKLGEELKVEAVLTDPVLDIRFNDLELADLDYEIPDLMDDDYLPYTIAFTTGLAVALFLWLLSLLIRSKHRFFLTSAGLVTVLTIGFAIVCYLVNLKLDYREVSPSVAITRSNGEIVASGAMPFG